MNVKFSLLSLCATFPTIFAQLQAFTPPGQNAITYSVNIPESTASAGTGPIFIQMKSTHEVQWFAWGQGSRMQGANIFVVYSSANGQNVTVSPRLGVEHVEPKFNPQAQLSLLDGSGIRNGVMTANIRCDSCINWPGGHEDLSSSSSPWIWAVKHGTPLNSDSLSQTITIHDSSGVAAFDLQQATGGASDNPFATTSHSTVSTAGHSLSSINSRSITKLRTAHATLMIVVFVILFPLFALIMHVFPSSKIVDIHASLQLLTLALAIAGLGIGISMAKTLHLTGGYHPIIGIVAVSCLILFQPATGVLQHRHYHKTGGKGVFAYLHRWAGRTLIVLGIVNAGLGFHFAKKNGTPAPTGAVIAMSVVAGVVGLVYALVVVFLPRVKRRRSSV